MRTTRCLRGRVESVVTLTPYALQTLVEDLWHSGYGTSVDVRLPTDAGDAVLRRVERMLAPLRRLGVDVTVWRGDDEHEPAPEQRAPAGVPRVAAQLAIHTGRLLHECEHERAVAATHLAARDGVPPAALEAQWSATDDAVAAWQSWLVASADSLPSSVRTRAEAVRGLLAEREATREGLRHRTHRAADVVAHYTRLARAVLATVDALLVSAATSEPAVGVSAELSSLHAREEVAARDAYLRAFATTAPEALL